MCRTTIPRSRNNSSDVKFWLQVISKGVSVVSTVSSRGIRPESQSSCPLDYNLFAKKKMAVKSTKRFGATAACSRQGPGSPAHDVKRCAPRSTTRILNAPLCHAAAYVYPRWTIPADRVVAFNVPEDRDPTAGAGPFVCEADCGRHIQGVTCCRCVRRRYAIQGKLGQWNGRAAAVSVCTVPIPGSARLRCGYIFFGYTYVRSFA